MSANLMESIWCQNGQHDECGGSNCTCKCHSDNGWEMRIEGQVKLITENAIGIERGAYIDFQDALITGLKGIIAEVEAAAEERGKKTYSWDAGREAGILQALSAVERIEATPWGKGLNPREVAAKEKEMTLSVLQNLLNQ
jgi:hypothetical protein